MGRREGAGAPGAVGLLPVREARALVEGAAGAVARARLCVFLWVSSSGLGAVSLVSCVPRVAVRCLSCGLWVLCVRRRRRGASGVVFCGLVRPGARRGRSARTGVLSRRVCVFPWERGCPSPRWDGGGCLLRGAPGRQPFSVRPLLQRCLRTFGHSATAVPAASASTMSFILPSSGALMDVRARSEGRWFRRSSPGPASGTGILAIPANVCPKMLRLQVRTTEAALGPGALGRRPLPGPGTRRRSLTDSAAPSVSSACAAFLRGRWRRTRPPRRRRSSRTLPCASSSRRCAASSTKRPGRPARRHWRPAPSRS